MMTTSISNLKAHLSAILKSVINGHPYVVLDRDHPVVRLLPYDDSSRIVVREPISSDKKIKRRFKGKLSIDPVEILLNDRKGREH